jgi:hypothetical protein
MAGYEVLTSVTMKGTTFWDVVPYSSVEANSASYFTYSLTLKRSEKPAR